MPAYDRGSTRLVHLGFGDISVCTGRATNSLHSFDDEILFVVAPEAHPNGEETDQALVQAGGPPIENASVRLVFDKIESLAVVIEQLERLRSGWVESLALVDLKVWGAGELDGTCPNGSDGLKAERVQEE